MEDGSPVHDFDDDFPEHVHLELEEQIEFGEDVDGLEKLTLTSVGIDIGSSTSHLMFSRLTLQRKGADLSAVFEVTDRRVLYQSPILLTPYVSSTLIDVARLEEFIQEHYRRAGFAPSDVDTGVVVITGEALNKENAQPIAELFARQSGKFICASAGPHHEALLAAYGCGAVAASRAGENTVLNVDLGGGTTKLSVIRNGVVSATAAISVGARLLAFDEAGRVVRIEAPGRRYLRELGREVALGDVLSEEEKQGVARLMAKSLREVIEGAPQSALARELMVTEPLHDHPGVAGIDFVVFSGGVSEYVYGHEETSYGDLGLYLGAAVRHQVKHTGLRLLVRPPNEGIRATVIGAGEYTVQASGVTSYLSDLEVLPVFGLKVVKAVIRAGQPVRASLEGSLRKFDLQRFEPGLAIALALQEQPNYRLVQGVATEIAEVLRRSTDPAAPLYLIVDADIAKSLGGILKEELALPGEVIAIDGIDVGDLDYVDIGRPMGISESLPVTVKSLVFPHVKRG
jgi:ethanolamine utilization protein EutA